MDLLALCDAQLHLQGLEVRFLHVLQELTDVEEDDEVHVSERVDACLEALVGFFQGCGELSEKEGMNGVWIG